MSKVVLITGSSSGFGELTTRSLSDQGYTVYASMRNVNGKNSEKAAELGALAGVNVVDLDVTDQSSIENAVNSIISKEGKIDVLVNNAGIGTGGFTEPYSANEFQKVFDVNALPFNEFAASLGLASVPKIKFISNAEKRSAVAAARKAAKNT